MSLYLKIQRQPAQAAILKIFLDAFFPNNEWAKNLYLLVNEYPNINIKRMGFDKDWVHDSFWVN